MTSHCMKTNIKNLFSRLALIIGLGLILVGRMTAQTFTTLHNFTALTPDYSNSDGAFPDAGLISSGNILYGTAANGGRFGEGTVFALNLDGSGFTTLHSFTPTSPPGLNSDGVEPEAGLILSGNILYGTAYGGGGKFGGGTVFALNIDGTGFMTLHDFAGFPTD